LISAGSNLSENYDCVSGRELATTDIDARNAVNTTPVTLTGKNYEYYK